MTDPRKVWHPRDNNISHSDSRCKYPALYKAPARPSAELEVVDILNSFVFALKPDYVLETGTAFGHTAYEIGVILKAVGHGRLHTLEADESRFRGAVSKFQALPVTGWNTEYQKWTPPKDVMFDMAFFDATRDTRDEEYEHFKPYLNPGAILFFHDSGDNHPSERTWGIDLPKIFVPTPRGLLIMQHPWE